MPELPLILVGATIFAVVMALMYAIVGLYRPAPISMLSAAGRIVFALAVGGYVTSLSLRTVADRGYIEQLLPAAIAYLAIGLVFVRGGMVLDAPCGHAAARADHRHWARRRWRWRRT